MIKLAVIAGSTRPGRFNNQPATWAYELAKKRSDVDVELIDLAEVNLPLLDEPVPPKMQQYSKEHTKQWSAKIDSKDAFLIISPEYNHSIPAALKNALDYIFYEWNYKPVGFISYGSTAGGARAVEHLRGVAGELKMYDIREQLPLADYWENLDETGKFKFTERHDTAANEIIEQLIFWAGVMKKGREELKSKQK